MDLVENDVDILHGEIKYLVDHLVENDVDTLHEERIYLVGFSFIRVIICDILRVLRTFLITFSETKGVFRKSQNDL